MSNTLYFLKLFLFFSVGLVGTKSEFIKMEEVEAIYVDTTLSIFYVDDTSNLSIYRLIGFFFACFLFGLVILLFLVTSASYVFHALL